MRCFTTIGSRVRSRRAAARGAAAFGSESGSAVIEFTLAYLLGMLLVLGIVESCTMLYTYAVVGEAARHGLRYAIVHGSNSSLCSGPATGCADQTGTNVNNDVTAYAGRYLHSVSGLAASTTYAGTSRLNPLPSLVIVSVTYAYSPILRLKGFHVTFTASAQGRILY